MRGKMALLRFRLVAAAAAAALFVFIALRPQAGSSTGASTPKVAFRSAASSGPIERLIVSDLTPQLTKGLTEHGIKALLVLAAEDDSTLKLEWKALQRAGISVAFAPSYEQLLLAWHRSVRPVCVADAAVAGATLLLRRNLTALRQDTDDASVGASGGGGSVALLVKAGDGALRLREAQLVTVAAQRLRQCLGLTAAYGLHADKGDSLILFGLGGTPLSAAFLSTNVFRDKFSAIYDQQVWGSGEYNGGGSGHGSNMNYTKTVRAVLPALIARYNIKSMIDSSCGSMHWMPLVLENVSRSQPDFRFMGTDVACSVVGNHSVRFAAAHKNWRFKCVDYANQPLPRGYDLVWSRDSLQHLPLHAAWMFLNNVKASGARYLLVGSYIRAAPGSNVNIPAGEYYSINLLAPPFSVGPAPVEVIDEQTEDGKHLLLFDVAKMTWQDDLLGLV